LVEVIHHGGVGAAAFLGDIFVFLEVFFFGVHWGVRGIVAEIHEKWFAGVPVVDQADGLIGEPVGDVGDFFFRHLLTVTLHEVLEAWVFDWEIAAATAEKPAEVVESLLVRVHFWNRAQVLFSESHGFVTCQFHGVGVGRDGLRHAIFSVR